MSDGAQGGSAGPETGSRRSFLKRVLLAGGAAPVSGSYLRGAGGGEGGTRDGASGRGRAPDADRGGSAGQSARVGPLDHVAVPIRDVEAMVSFYRALGFRVREGERIVSVHFGDQKINFHRPSLWRDEGFTLRAPAARPPCGDFCWVWQGDRSALLDTLERAGAPVVAEGERTGGRDGGDAVGRSVYVRDPDGNLLEFIRYP